MKRVPNILTLIRLFLIPFYLMVFYSDTAHPVRWAMIIFLVASLTDIIDGYIARKYDAITKFGQVADPFADKVMQISVLYTLMDIGYIENWFFLIVLIKDGLQNIPGRGFAECRAEDHRAGECVRKSHYRSDFCNNLAFFVPPAGIDLPAVVRRGISCFHFLPVCLSCLASMGKK